MKSTLRLALVGAVLSLCLGCPTPPATNDDGGTGGGDGGGGGTVTGGGTGGGDDGGLGGGTGGGVTGGGGGTTGGGAGGGTAFDAGTSLALIDFCDAWASAYCDREAACQFLDSAQGMTCVARVKDACAFWQRQVAAGVYAYDAAQGAACATATGNYACVLGRGFNGGALNFALGNGPAACDPLLTGVGVAGTPCGNNGDCAAGFTCAGAGTACRVCTAIPTVGQACTPAGGGGCFNAACRPAGDGGNECIALAMPGEVCAGGGTCDPATTRGCAPAPTDGGMRTCLPKDPDGTTCTMGQSCQSNYCNNGNRTDAGVRTCGPIALGSPCGGQGDCAATAFCSGLTATVPGTCTARIPLGDACTIQRTADQNDGCADSGLCLDGLCKARLGQQQVGQSCRTSSLDCASGAWCPNLPNDGGYPLCVAQLTAGTMCNGNAECQPGLRCNNNVCTALASAGGQCFAAQQCKDILTCPQADAGTGFFACTPLVSEGGDCSANGSSCASGVDNGQGGFCARDAGVASCFAPVGLGGDCGANAQCASGRCLLDDAGVVMPPARGLCQAPCVP